MRYVHTIAIACCLAFGPALADEVGQISTNPSQVVEYDLGITTEVAVEATPEGKASKIVVVSATWCLPCEVMKPALLGLRAKGYTVEIYSLDTDNHLELFTERYSNIKHEKGDLINQWTKYPTIFYIEDGTIIKKDVGRKTAKEILTVLWKPEGTPNAWDKLFDGIEARLPWKN